MLEKVGPSCKDHFYDSHMFCFLGLIILFLLVLIICMSFFIFMRVLLIYQGPALQGSLVCANLSLIV